MFSGIVEDVGKIVALRRLEDVRELEISAPLIRDGLSVGASVALDGACHTVTTLTDGGFIVTSIGTTLSRTVASSYREGSEVNLERAVKMGSRLDGHFVQGHVDAVGRVIGMEERGGYRLIDFEIPPEVEDMIVLHGSIAINGVSLTINEISDDGRCQVGIIPFTWENTNLRNLLAGNQVNVETDLIGKYVRNLMRDPFSEIQV